MIHRHTTYPLRRIVRREVQAGTPVVVLECQHAAPGKPASRCSRFYPCPVCHEQREAHAKALGMPTRASRRRP